MEGSQEVTSRISQTNAFRRRLSAMCGGFTLIEAMIVVGILAIVVALAYPSYIDSVRKARRADAESSLLAAAQLMERCFTRLNSYAVGEGACPDPTGESDDGYYTISFDDGQPTATTYTLVATAQGDQANDHEDCTTYTLDHLGNKAPAPGPARCWGSSG